MPVMTDTCDSCARPWPAIDTLFCAPSTNTSRRARRSLNRRAATSCGLNFRKPSTRWNCTGWRCRMASALHLDTCFPLTGGTGTTSGSTSDIPTTKESKEHFTPSARLRRHWPECSASASPCGHGLDRVSWLGLRCLRRCLQARWRHGEQASIHEAACRQLQFLAGTGQSGVQVDRSKPAIQGGPAGEILRGSPRAGCGRALPANGFNRRSAVHPIAAIQAEVVVRLFWVAWVKSTHPCRRMHAISLGDSTGCSAHQQSFEAVKIALHEFSRS